MAWARGFPSGPAAMASDLSFGAAISCLDLAGAAGKAADLGGERPLPSIARFGRLAYPMRGEVTNRAVLGRKRHGRPEHPIGWAAVGTTWVAANSEA